MNFLKIIFALLFCLSLSDSFCQSTPTPFVVRGTSYNRFKHRLLKIGNQTIYNIGGGRGLRLTVISKSNQSVLLDKLYDTYWYKDQADLLANDLNAITRDQIGFISSFDAWEHNISDNLSAAFERLGLTIAAAMPKSARKPYAAVFEGASEGERSGKAYEVAYTASANQPYATLVGYLYQGGILASGSNPNALMTPQGDQIGLVCHHNANIGIGTSTPNAKLEVNGGVLAQEIKVMSAPGADFVFEEDYALLPLDELQRFIEKNNHLPDIPSAKEMEQSGSDLAKMNQRLLQKIEELTLYILEQDQKMKNQSERIDRLESLMITD